MIYDSLFVCDKTFPHLIAHSSTVKGLRMDSKKRKMGTGDFRLFDSHLSCSICHLSFFTMLDAHPYNQILRTPPQNIEAEISVLGSLLIDKDAIVKIADALTSEDFYKDAHGRIYKTILELFEHREPIDILSLSTRLEEKKLIESVGGKTYLVSLVNAVPTSANVAHYASIVAKKATLRRLITSANEVMSLGYQEAEDIEVLLDSAEQKIFGVSQRFQRQNFLPIKSLLLQAFDQIDELHRDPGKLRGVATGFPDLDEKLAGFQKSDLVIIGARPSMGKTSLALDFVRNTATRSRVPSGYFSLEMSADQITQRMMCAEANVDFWKLRTGRLSDREEVGNANDFSKLNYAMGVLSESPIFIDDSPMLNVMQIRAKARRLQAEQGLGILFIDYLQLMPGPQDSENRVQEISYISRSLKALARELNIPVVALSQLSRQTENRPGAVPRLADLRESGAIEQDADVVMFIHREKMYKKDTPKGNITEIHIAKHRNGPTGEVELYFDEAKVTFRSLDKRTAVRSDGNGVPQF